MRKTLGGDRVGSGKKMQVDLHEYGRSTHDLGYIWKSTMAAGTLVPFMVEVALPGDTWDIRLDLDVKTHPTIGPLFGSYKAQADVYLCPVRLYQAQLHNNKLGIGRKMADVKLPQMTLTGLNTNQIYTEGGDVDNAQINPSCILKYLGISGVGSIGATEITGAQRRFNALSLLMYWDIYKNYYANKQEEFGAVIHAGNTTPIETVDSIEIGNTVIPENVAGVGQTVGVGEIIEVLYTGVNPIMSELILITSVGAKSIAELSNDMQDIGPSFQGTYSGAFGDILVYNWRYLQAAEPEYAEPRVVMFPLENIDTMREELLMTAGLGNVAVNINDIDLAPYNYLLNAGAGSFTRSQSKAQEGLALKTYQSDIFNNWLSTEWIDGVGGVTAVTAISTAGGSFTLDTLNLAKKVYDMLNRVAVSGGSYGDWLDVNWTSNRYTMTESPIYHGGLSKELVFQEVVSNSESAEGQPLGTLAGKGVMAKKHKGGHITIKPDEPAYIMGIISLTPRIDYSQGNRWDVNLQTMDDFHKPALDQIGFQELIMEKMAWWTTTYDGTLWHRNSIGKQPAWMDYMTNYNRTYGNFAIDGNEMFMTLNRRYQYSKGGSDADYVMADATTYIDPSKYNNIFADTALDAQNFWVQMAVDAEVRRVMSAKIMPNL